MKRKRLRMVDLSQGGRPQIPYLAPIAVFRAALFDLHAGDGARRPVAAAELARWLGVSRAQVKRWLRHEGRPPAEQLGPNVPVEAL